MTKSLVNETGPRVRTSTQNLQNPKQDNYDVQQQKKGRTEIQKK